MKTYAPVLFLLLLFPEALHAEVRLIEADDERFVTLGAQWQRLGAREAREAGIASVTAGTPGASLRLDFHGRSVAIRARSGPVRLRIRIRARPQLFAWRRFEGPRFTCTLDGKNELTFDLSGGPGWTDAPLYEGLEPGPHVLALRLLSGTLIVDRFPVSDAGFTRAIVRVADGAGVPVTDAVVEFRSEGRLAGRFRTGRSGSTGVITVIPPGTYSVAASPGDGDGNDDPSAVTEDPRLPVLRNKVRVEEGKLLKLDLVLPYADVTLRPPSSILRPALGFPVLRKPGEAVPIVLRAGTAGPDRVNLVFPSGKTLALKPAPLGAGFPASAYAFLLPSSLPEGAYGIDAAGQGWRETTPPVVHVFDTRPDRYTIAHISDSHIENARRDWGAYRSLMAVALDAQKAGAAFAVISGDLTDNGIPSQQLRLRRALVRFPLPVFLCEGNHDHFDGAHHSFYRGATAWDRFVGLRAYGFSFGRDRFAVLGTGFYEALPPGQIEGAVRFLEGAPGLKGLVSHFDYTEGTPSIAPGLRGDQVGHLIARVGANLWLEGHQHRQRKRRVATAAALMAPASRDGAYALVEIKEGGLAGVEARALDLPGKGAPAREPAPDPSVFRAGALEKVRALYRFAPPVEALRQCLKPGGDWLVLAAASRSAAWEGLVRELSGELKALLAESNPLVREEAVNALGEDSRFTPLKPALSDPDPRVRLAVVRALGRVRGRPSYRALLSLLADPDPGVGGRAAEVLGTFGVEGAIRDFGTALRNRELPASVRLRLVGALKERDPSKASKELFPLLSDGDASVRGAAALALGRWRERRAVPELIRLVEEGLDAEQAEAHRILARITKKSFGYGTPEAREKWESWWRREGARQGD